MPPKRHVETNKVRPRHESLRTNCKLQVYAVLAKEGVSVPMTDLFGVSRTECWRPAISPRPIAPASSRSGT